MSEYYNPNRSRNLYDPKKNAAPDGEPFRLSRSKIELFLDCPRCFYLDRRLGVGRPPGFPFALNSAVDTLLKKEFDIHRAKKTAHPLMKTYGVDAIPFAHSKLDEWRENFKGVQCHHPATNFVMTGAVDDLWVREKAGPKGEDEIIIVDYKATSKETKVTLDAEWQGGYKRQMEMYQWLLRRSGFTVSNTGYFVYCNGKTDRKAFDGKLEFDIDLIPYTGSDAWVEGALMDCKKCLDGEAVPTASADCDYCLYRNAVAKVVKNAHAKKNT
jgi:hypothetical protein